MFVRVCVCYDITVVLVKHCVSCHDDSDVGHFRSTQKEGLGTRLDCTFSVLL